MKAPLAAFLFSLGLNLTGHSILPTAFFVSSSEIADEVNSAGQSTPNKDGTTTPFIPDENIYARIKATRSRRMAEQRERVRQKIASGEFDAKYGPNAADNSDSTTNKAQSEGGQFHRITEEQLHTLVNNAYENDPNLTKRNHEWIKRGNLREALNDPRRRHLWGNSINRDPYATPSGMADSSQEFESWQQAFRKIGDFVDCSNMFYNGGGSHDSGDNEGKCAHWTMWCAYVDPYYTGNGYYEYHGDDAPGSLSCHKPDSGWELIGCYAQELYQFYEQLSKHVWAIDDYEYVVALAGLAYMTDEHCQGPAYDGYNNAIYFGVQGQQNGDIQMATYKDDKCLYPIDTDITYDDYYQSDGVNLGSKDQGQSDETMEQIEEWWYDSQEYTMTLFNEVYDDYKYCTSCMDYPTYQDGYFIGDTGTDDDDLINQCWKFYSHDSFACNADCMAMAVFQGSALQVTMNGKTFGTSFDGQYDGQHSSSSSSKNSANAQATRIERLKANLYLTMSGIVFVATFLAFAVARGSSKKKKASSRSRSRRLLDADYGGDSSRRRSSSRAKSSSRTSSRSASKSRSSSSRSKSRSRRSEVGDYKSPSSASGDRARSKSRSRTSSSRK